MRIEVRTPAEVNEVSRALQLRNRQRLEDRQADGWAERKATRLVQRARSFADNRVSKAAKDDPWKCAVPEFDPTPEVRARILGRRFEVAGAYFQYGQNERLTISTADRQVLREIQLPSVPLWHEAFPAGGDRMVILFYGWEGGVTYNEVPGSTVYTNCQPASCFEALEQADNDLALQAVFNAPDVTVVRVDSKNECTQTNTPSQRLVSSYTINPWFYSVTVSRTSILVKEGWPAQARSVIGQKYKIATGAGQVANTGEPKYGSTGLTQVVVFEIEYTNKPAVLLTYTYQVSSQVTGVVYDQGLDVVTTPNSYEEPTLLQFSAPGGPDIVGEWVFYPLMRSYGYGYLVNRDKEGQTPGWGNTPAVFSFIKNYRGEFHKENGDRTMLDNGMSYQYARDNYFPIDAPAYFLTADVVMPEAEQDTTHNYYFFPAPPIDGSVYANDPMAFRNDGATAANLALRLNRQPYRSEVVRQTFAGTQQELDKTRVSYFLSKLEIPVAAWDWDRPLACWIELTRLGFTPADLMLSESEAQALAEADPAEAAFKF